MLHRLFKMYDTPLLDTPTRSQTIASILHGILLIPFDIVFQDDKNITPPSPVKTYLEYSYVLSLICLE